MNGTEIPGTRSAREVRMRYGLVLSLMGLGLFLVLGAAGLLLEGPGESAAEGDSDTGVIGLVGWRPADTQTQVLAADVPRPLVRRAEGWNDHPESSVAGTPLALVSDGLAEVGSKGDGWRTLLLEPDGTLRAEGTGTLVGFLHGEGTRKRGEQLAGPGLIAIDLLHQDAWLAERARVPVVEPDGTGGWIVLEHRSFEIGVDRQPPRTDQLGPGRPKLHPRTGLPQVELVALMD